MEQEFFFDVNATQAVPTTVSGIITPAQHKTTAVSGGMGSAIFLLIIALFLFIWWIIGTVGFIMSLICFGYSGSMSDKFLGLIMAWVTGPFYWLYYIYNSNYCTKNIYYQQ